MTDPGRVIFTLPSKGELAEPTIRFLTDCGLRPVKTSPRQYAAQIPALPNVSVLFQRAQDIAPKVADGTADLGITGLDIVSEYEEGSKSLITLHENLGYGHCDLVLAVPETWIDVDSLADIAEVALDFREVKGRDLRVATKFPNLVRRFLLENGVSYFSIVAAHGAIEAAPAMGYADIVADLSTTGTTLRANHLKPLEDGVILRSQACLIANARALRQRKSVLDVARSLLEVIDATLQGQRYTLVTASVRGESAKGIAHRLLEEQVVEGQEQLTIMRIERPDHTTECDSEILFSVSLTIDEPRLLHVVTCLREMGAANILVTPVRYRFTDRSESYARMMTRLRHKSST